MSYESRTVYFSIFWEWIDCQLSNTLLGFIIVLFFKPTLVKNPF